VPVPFRKKTQVYQHIVRLSWELLCLYCHDNEHSRYTDQQYFSDSSLSTPKVAKATHNPFAALAGLMKKDE